MGYKLTRWTILAVYASLIIIPVMVVMLGSFKTMSELFEPPSHCRGSGGFRTTSTS